MSFQLPAIPAKHSSFVSYLHENPEKPLRDLVRPYKEYESKLREVFAQHRNDPVLGDPAVNAVPIFSGHEGTLKTRARDPANDADNDKYIMPLKAEDRRAHGSPATAASLKEFRNNFDLFSEQSLSDLNWDNVIVAGSSVVTAMLPVPEQYRGSKRALREYYHQKLAPSSDVDLFLVGLDEAGAVKKIAEIEECVRNSILAETTTIRTKNAITIASQYPTRHIQIVLRLYKNLSEVLTGFDIDSSCFAYDGKQVWATPRGVTAYCSQINEVDLSRRSPSYETRLAKYAHRGFEVYFPELDRTRIDPTLFERSFVRTLGLARLLLLERLPTQTDRENYLNQRRIERGRPELDFFARRFNRGQLPGNMKENDPEDIPDWEFDDAVASYHTFTVPYGPKYHAKKIERLLFTKDMLLNAEWNKNEDRKVNLHRHPCFISDVSNVIHDCCGVCPEPTDDEERQVAKEESKTYVSGEIKFLVDDPGRQQIGSFNPLTELDWTDMAYLGNTQILCEAIVDNDVDAVRTWLDHEQNDVNHRDHSGRMPLHLAIMCGHIEIVQTLIQAGARITSRIQDGFTSLHMAAAVGRADIIKLIGEKSEANEAVEADREDIKRASDSADVEVVDIEKIVKHETEESDDESEDYEHSDDAGDSEEDDDVTQGSFVKVKKEEDKDVALDDPFGPDFFDFNVLAWDAPLSPIHVAILAGHPDCIETLVSLFGADPLLPVAFRPGPYSGGKNNALLPLVLACKTAPPDTIPVIRELINRGVKPSQSDPFMISALHHSVILRNVEAMKAMVQYDLPSTKVALNFLTTDAATNHWRPSFTTPLMSAIKGGDKGIAHALLEIGAHPVVEFEDFAKTYLRSTKGDQWRASPDEDELRKKFSGIDQPVLLAASAQMPSVVKSIIEAGVDVNTVDGEGGRKLANEYSHGQGATVLDKVNFSIESVKSQINLDKFKRKVWPNTNRRLVVSDDTPVKRFENGGYEDTVAAYGFELARTVRDGIERVQQEAEHNELQAKPDHQKKFVENPDRKQELLAELEELRDWLQNKGARAFSDLYPEHKVEQTQNFQQSGSGKKVYTDDVGVYTFEHSFRDPGASKRKREAYMKLFNAAWDGDLDTIKALTLKPIEDDEGAALSPLPITTKDCVSQTVLGIAIGRKHHHMVQAIIDIAQAQYKPKDTNGKQEKRRYRIRPQDEDDIESDHEIDPEAIPITSEVVDNEFTIDDLGKLTETVGSEVSVDAFINDSGSMMIFGAEKRAKDFDKDSMGFDAPWEPIEKAASNAVKRLFVTGGLISYAVDKNDLELVRFLLRTAKKVSPPTMDWSKDYELGACLQKSIKQGKTAIIEELITTAGVLMPLEKLMAEVKSPEDVQEERKYYQGLKLYGRHKKDWAQQASGDRAPQTTQAVKWSPLLSVIGLAHEPTSLRAVEYWLSDAAFRMYKQFGEKNRDDKTIAALTKNSGGWESVVSNWLGLRRNLALHVAVLACDTQEDIEVLQYLLRVLPEDLDKKSKNGYTPLWLAFASRDSEAARMLIDRGADQTARDKLGNNILHTLLSPDVQTWRGAKTEYVDPQALYDQFEALLESVDKRLLVDLFTERSSVEVTGVTPFAVWTRRADHDERIYDILDKYMPEDVYSMYDGSGQTPVHSLVMKNNTSLLKKIVSKRPYVLGLENGSGQTVFELAQARFIQAQGSQTVPTHSQYISEADSVLKGITSTYTTLRDLVRANPQIKRKAISVNDAREVSRRLAERQKGGQLNNHIYQVRSWRRYGQGDDGGDEVDQLFQEGDRRWLIVLRNSGGPRKA